VVVAAGGAGALAVGATLAHRRRHPLPTDPTGGQPLVLPPGEEALVATPDGGEVAVLVAGSGARTIVLAHGWTNDRRIWGPVARRLVERGCRVVVYDQRGHAGSRAGSDGLTISALADDLAAVLDHVDARGATVVGHSMGGMATQALLVERPEVVRARVGAAVLVSTACEDVGGPDALRRVTSRMLAARPSTGRWRPGPRPEDAPRRRRSSRPPEPPRRRPGPAGGDPCPDPHGPRAAMAAMDLSEALSQVELPVAVVVGSRDRLTPPAQSRRLAAVIPGASLQVVPGAGHMLSLEAPDELTDLIERSSLVPSA
jgi:3-oxoadipate enol-lactonase